MQPIDLRSDTVTKPSPAMLEAMVNAELGDDGREGDPTVSRLEEMAAERLGKEAGLFVPSGTMANLLAHMTHCTHGAEVIAGDRAHTFTSEVGNFASIHGLSLKQIPTSGPFLDPALVEAAIRPSGTVYPMTELVWVENTQVGYGGMLTSLDNLSAVRDVANRHELRVHMDGARVFNAAIGLGVPASEIAQYADSVMFCISKGLSAPVGSLLVGGADFIEKATWHCKKIGGRMRQAGVIAAAGIVALGKMIDRLQDDHDNASFLAGCLQEVPGLEIDPRQVQTNIILARWTGRNHTRAEAVDALKSEGLWTLPLGKDILRFVTHYGIDRRDCEKAASICREVLGALAHDFH